MQVDHRQHADALSVEKSFGVMDVGVPDLDAPLGVSQG